MLKKALITAGLVLSFAIVCLAQVPQYVNYQGQLSDAAGNPLTGNYTINFRIYSSSAGSSLLWGPQTNTVNVDAGIFSAVLGPINYSVFDGSERWLSLQVGNDTEMTPRKRLLSVGNSFRAYDADKLDGKHASAFVQKVDGVAPNSNGNVDLVAGDNITITPNNSNNKITIAATTSGGSGDNLGNHTATKNIKLSGNWLSGDGGNEGVYITNAGNIGLGKSNPQKKLDVSGTVKMIGFQMVTNAGNNKVLTSDASGNGTWKTASSSGDNDWTISGNNMYSAVSGKVGIGTSSPTDKLHVNGGVRGTRNGHNGYVGYSICGLQARHQNGNLAYVGSEHFGVHGMCRSGSYSGVRGTHTGGDNFGEL